MIYPWQYELFERKQKVEHNLWSKEQTRFWGDGRKWKHWLEVVCNKCPQVALGVFTYLCTTIWSIFLPLSGTNQPSYNMLSRRWLSNHDAAPYLWLTTTEDQPLQMGWGDAEPWTRGGTVEHPSHVPCSPCLWATSLRLQETPGTSTVPQNAYFCWQGFSLLWVLCENTSSEVSQKTRRLSKEAPDCRQQDLPRRSWWPGSQWRSQADNCWHQWGSVKIICIEDREGKCTKLRFLKFQLKHSRCFFHLTVAPYGKVSPFSEQTAQLPPV